MRCLITVVFIGFIATLNTCLLAADVVDLSGTWKIAFDSEDKGLQQEWFTKELQSSDKIHLPNTTDLAGYGAPEENPDPGHLSRAHKYIGPVWYQRQIEVPPQWATKEIELFLERVLWQSRIWIDGEPYGLQDSLGTPHIHSIGQLKPGDHLLTVRVDNRMIHPIGDRGHCYTEFTQSIWNGIVGRLELHAEDSIKLGLVRLFPDAALKKVTFETTILNNSGKKTDGCLSMLIKDPQGNLAAQYEMAVELSAEQQTILKSTVPMNEEPMPWDEFTPNLYKAAIKWQAKNNVDQKDIRFGFRTITTKGNRLLINGRPSFMRGNLDCGQYPLTGHPPVDVKDWRAIFGVCRDYGINHVRLHSWCPPKAAFEAADEMGIYLLPEVLWIDKWMGGPNERKDMDISGYPKGVGIADRTIDDYVRAEMRRMLDTYGNHPSFCFFVIGNELGSSNFKTMGEWIRQEKERDGRRLYAASTARTITPYDDFSDTHNIPGIGKVVNRLGIGHTNWDYENVYRRAPVPIIAHESGQMPVYPNWGEIEKYKGPLKAKNFELFREMARKNGIAHQSKDFQTASGAMNRIIYKNEMEALLRSPGCSGVSWLSMQDFPGQGEALVGWLDTFYETKGIVTPEAFRRYSNTTVPLARFDKFTWTDNEYFKAKLQVAHWGKTLSAVTPEWKITGASGKIIDSGTLPAVNLQPGSLTDLGEIAFGLSGVDVPQKLNLKLSLAGTSFSNDWDIWVFESQQAVKTPENVVVTEDPKEALDALSEGKRVILLAHHIGSRKLAAWMPLFWSSRFFPGQKRDTLGALVRSNHPAMKGFPTGPHLDWQWLRVYEKACGFVLDDQPAQYHPIVQPVSDYHFNHKLGTIFEFASAEGGRLLVCGYDIKGNLEKRPAARQLRKSLFMYAAGDEFRPKTVIAAEKFKTYFPIRNDAPKSPAVKGFEKAVLYVKAGDHHPGSGNVPWEKSIDSVKADEGFDYTVKCNAVWKDRTASAWWGQPSLQLEIECLKPELYDLYVHFYDGNNKQRTGTITFEGREYDLEPHAGDGVWVHLEVLREDALDNQLLLRAEKRSGPNLMITAFALVPQNDPS